MIDLDQREAVGQGPWQIPKIGLGCVFLGDPFGPTDDGVMQDTLATAWNEGIRYFDTAPW